MNGKQIEKIATAYMEIWNAGNESILDQYAHENLVVYYSHFEKIFHGIAEYKAVLKMTHEFFPDLKITVNRILPAKDGNLVTVEWSYTGTHKNGNLFGVEPSNQKVSVNGISILQIENERVKKETGIVDNLSLAMQLGAFKKK